MPGLRAGAGECARRRSNFLSLRRKKVTKERATPSLRPLRGAKGQTCVVAVAGCAVELALLLRSAARTATASQMTKHGRCDAHATPQPPRRRRSHRGWTAEDIPTATRVVAALDPVCAARGACASETGPSEAMARVDVRMSLPLCMRRGAQRPADQGSRLFERSEFERDPAGREHRRLPQCVALGTQTVGSPSFAFFWGWSVSTREPRARSAPWRRKTTRAAGCAKRRCPAGGTSRHPPCAQACSQINP
jgi:hypothetical protein